MKIVFATNNAHKITEVQAVLGDAYTLVTPRDCGVTEEIPEDQETLEGNASQKARYLHRRTGLDCFADDTDSKSRRSAAPRAYIRPVTPPTAMTSRPTTACC